jgi:hypothetical protein
MLIKKRPNWIPEHVWLSLMRQRDRRKYLRRQILRFFRSPALAIAYSYYRKAIKQADWQLVKQAALEIRDIACEVGDRRTILDMVHALDRVGCYQESAKLWLNEIAPYKSKFSNEWRGQNLSNKNIIINLKQTAGDGLGVAFRCASLLPKVAALARDTTVIVETRLVKIFRRSFPELQFQDSVDETIGKSFDYVILPEILLAAFAPSDSSNFEFHALSADRDKIIELRTRYSSAQNQKKPLIGICWYSSHHGKDLPGLNYWRDFIDQHCATFVSLQYGDVSKAVSIFRSDRIIVDQSINQLVDMDAFVAQVSALDGVITIINTLVHVSAALGVPTVVLRDDWFRRDLPVLSDTVPWYPTMRVAGKNRRDWAPVFDEAFAKLNGIHR